MKKNIVLIMAILVLVLVVMPASAMINGEPDTEHTNVGAIVFHWQEQYPEYEYLRACSGTLIHPQVLLTAAHCPDMLENGGLKPKEHMWVTFDQEALSDGATYYGVDKIIYHPDFKVGGVSSSDIALVILRETVEDIEPQKLSRKYYLNRLLATIKGKDKRTLQFVVVGYGTQGLTTTPEFLLDAKRLTGTVTFEQLLEREIKSSNVNPEENAHLCAGDSGGPLFYLDAKRGEEVLLGVYSRSGIDSDCIDEPMFHYRLDTPSAQAFILDNLPPEPDN